MRLDHLSFAAGPDGLASTAQRIGGLLGQDFVDGGVHPRFGTRNMILPLAGDTYLEIVEVLDHPASDKAPFGQAVRARSALGGGWLGWVVAVDDITAVEARLGREAGDRQPAPPRRHRAALEADRRQRPDRRPAAAVLHRVGHAPPSCTPAPARTRRFSLACLEIAGDPQRVSEWLGETVEAPLEDVKVEWVAPHGTPGIIAAQVQTPARAGPDLTLEVRRRPGPARRPPAPTSGTTRRPTRSRTAPSTPTVRSRPRCASLAPTGPGRDRARPRLRHRLPPAPLRRRRPPSVIGVEPHPDLVALARRRTRRLAERDGPAGHGPVAAAAGRLGRRRARAVGLLLRPGLRARAGRARPRRTPRRHGVRHRQRPDPVDVRRLVPRAATPTVDPAAVERFWSDARLDPHPGRHRAGRSRSRADLEAVVRIEFARRRRRRRSWPSTRAPRSTTPSTSGRGSLLRRPSG